MRILIKADLNTIISVFIQHTFTTRLKAAKFFQDSVQSFFYCVIGGGSQARPLCHFLNASYVVIIYQMLPLLCIATAIPVHFFLIKRIKTTNPTWLNLLLVVIWTLLFTICSHSWWWTRTTLACEWLSLLRNIPNHDAHLIPIISQSFVAPFPAHVHETCCRNQIQTERIFAQNNKVYHFEHKHGPSLAPQNRSMLYMSVGLIHIVST